MKIAANALLVRMKYTTCTLHLYLKTICIYRMYNLHIMLIPSINQIWERFEDKISTEIFTLLLVFRKIISLTFLSFKSKCLERNT
jgi:hypothetical protein